MPRLQSPVIHSGIAALGLAGGRYSALWITEMARSFHSGFWTPKSCLPNNESHPQQGSQNRPGRRDC
ncbi:hypothetical protein MARHY0730 [Marinobacter nauticus ATCC 49840]|nr:hypothetical protein MARHY0730 [Marinobacter nauticus ATCC 49840]